MRGGTFIVEECFWGLRLFRSLKSGRDLESALSLSLVWQCSASSCVVPTVFSRNLKQYVD